jgi:hypothetical protein
MTYSWVAFSSTTRRFAISQACWHTATRDEFDDWITAASPPQEAFEAPRVEVDSLDGLVDLAIDTNRRVIEDADRGEYLVLGDGVIYTYTPARRSIDFEFERS